MSGGSTLFNEPYRKGPFVELMLRHSNGKRAGYDKDSGRILSELSESCYVELGIDGAPELKSLALARPMEGRYELFISADDSGVYAVDVDITENDDYVSKSVTGLIRRGEVQTAEITYSGAGDKPPVIRKKVDTDLLKKELEIALKRGGLDRNAGKEAARDLMEAERAFANKANRDAASSLKDFIGKLEKTREKLRIKDEKDIKAWFTNNLTRDPYETGETLKKQEVLFRDINNIREEKKQDWFEAQSAAILTDDAKIMAEDLSPEKRAGER